MSRLHLSKQCGYIYIYIEVEMYVYVGRIMLLYFRVIYAEVFNPVDVIFLKCVVGSRITKDFQIHISVLY